MPVNLSMRILGELSPMAQIELALFAARLAWPFWLRAVPEEESRAPLLAAMDAVEAFCASGQLQPDAKAIAVLAYRTVSSCSVRSGDIQRCSGFSIAHVAMAPWLLSMGESDRSRHNAMVAINYSESIHRWAGRLRNFEVELISRAEELRLA